MKVGPFEMVGAGVLALLAATAVLAIAVLLLWMAALTVVTPAMAALDVRVRHKRRDAWRRLVLDSWLIDGDLAFEPPAPQLPPVRGLSRVRSRDEHDDIQLIAAELAPVGPIHPALFTPMSVVHARLDPASRLELPPQAGGEIVVYVLAGRGIVGSGGQAVRAGEVAVLSAGTPVCLVAGSEPGQRFEALVLNRPGDARSPGRGGLVVRPFSTQMRQRLVELRALTDDLPVSLDDSRAADTEPAPRPVQGAA